MRGRGILAMVAALAACQGAKAPRGGTPTADEAVADGSETGFWTDGEPDPTLRAVGVCEGKARCPSAKHVERLLVPDAPSKEPATCLPDPARLCADENGASVDAGAVARCRDQLLAGRGLGQVRAGEVHLSREGARLVAASAHSNELKHVALEGSPGNSALAASALLAVLETDELDRIQALRACEALAAELSSGSDPRTIASALTCLSHAIAFDQKSDVMTAWPGCPCGSYGRLLGEVCIEGGPGRPFPDMPMDPRLTGALEEAGRRARDAMAERDWSLEGLGLLGCHIVRFERGGNVLGIAAQTSPRLRASDVSSHSGGVACDLKYAWIDRGMGSLDDSGYSVEMAFWTLADPGGARDVRDKRALLGELVARVARAGGEGPFYRALAAKEPTTDRRSSSAYAFAVVRNALVDAGFIVYTPATNPAHFNHLHFHLPPDAGLWTELADDATTPEQREQAVAEALSRAN